MADLGTKDRGDIWTKFMEDVSRVNEPVSIDKDTLQLAVNAVDSWIDQNFSSLISAMPAGARTGLTRQQITRALVEVMTRRFEVDA